MKTLVSIISVSALLAFGQNVEAAKTYYKWTDEDGTVHYSAHPPPDKTTETVKTYGGGAKAPTKQPSKKEAVPPPPKTATVTTTTEAPPPQKDPQRCSQAQNNLRVLQNNGRAQIRDANGETRYMTPEEFNEQIRLSQQVIEKEC